jgi:prepilin-type N-terminal cleavage/methylation domain-containing protein
VKKITLSRVLTPQKTRLEQNNNEPGIITGSIFCLGSNGYSGTVPAELIPTVSSGEVSMPSRQRQRLHPVSLAESTRGFTLIELLVVIAIIAVLAAILFPVFAQARGKARQAACLSNQRQIATSLMMYTQDYDEYIVPALLPTNLPRDAARRDYTTWTFLVQPYLKNGQPQNTAGTDPIGVMQCPSFDYKNIVKAGNDFYEPFYGPNSYDGYFPATYTHAHYGIGLGFQGDASDCGTPYYHFAGGHVLSDPDETVMMALHEVQRAAETVIVADGFTGVAATGDVTTMMGAESSEAHQHGANVIFLDSHARWIAGNPERYVEKDANGCLYEKYFTIDR